MEALSQLYGKTHNGPPVRVYGSTPLTPDIVERLIQDQPINMQGMLQSVWKLLHEKDLLLSTKKNVKKVKEPLIRILNMLQFAYHASIVTPDDDEHENEEDKDMRELTKRQVRSLVNPIMLTSALTPNEERALASFLMETMNKLSPPQEIDDDVISSEESEEEDETADIQNPLNDLPAEKNGNDAPQDNNDNSQPSNSRVFIEGSQQSAADILSRTDPKSNITVEQLLNMHMDSLALFQDVIKTNGQVSNIQYKIQTFNQQFHINMI